MRTITAALMLLASAAGFAAPDRTSTEAVESLKAYALYKAGNYEQARLLWEDLAARGNTTAMNNLANLYDQGQGVDEDPAQAARLLKQAAKLGDPVAQLNLGLAYEKGRGVERNNQTAAHWFRQAAVKGDKDAQFNLGVMLATAYGAGPEKVTPEQRSEALEWLRKAAAQQHPEAADFLRLLGE